MKREEPLAESLESEDARRKRQKITSDAVKLARAHPLIGWDELLRLSGGIVEDPDAEPAARRR